MVSKKYVDTSVLGAVAVLRGEVSSMLENAFGRAGIDLNITTAPSYTLERAQRWYFCANPVGEQIRDHTEEAIDKAMAEYVKASCVPVDKPVAITDADGKVIGRPIFRPEMLTGLITREDVAQIARDIAIEESSRSVQRQREAYSSALARLRQEKASARASTEADASNTSVTTHAVNDIDGLHPVVFGNEFDRFPELFEFVIRGGFGPQLLDLIYQRHCSSPVRSEPGAGHTCCSTRIVQEGTSVPTPGAGAAGACQSAAPADTSDGS